MHQLEGFLDHLGGVADHVEQANRVRQLGADGHQPRRLAGTTSDLVEHRPIGQRPVTFTAFQAPRKQAPFQVLATHGLPTTSGELPLDFRRQAHKTQPAVFGGSTATAHRQQVLVVFHQPGAVYRREALGLEPRQFHLGQPPRHALGQIGLQGFAGWRRFAAGQ
ncbi:hypothetical protein FQZ97_1018500 [compost metagenome]